MTAKQENLVRFDLSAFLIHFVRPMKIDRGDAPDAPEHWGWGNLSEDVCYSPFFLLRCIIRHGRIWATWSRRGGRRTIYGPRPAVCFTDMPIAAFVQTSHARAARGEKISLYAILLPKAAMFGRGARPVIYGLSRSRAVSLTRDDGARMLESDTLPDKEQYRYVAYDPDKADGPDWSHEREWRWAPAKYKPDPDYVPPPSSWEDVPGLELYTGKKIEGMGAMVRSEHQAALLVHDIIRLVDQGVLSEGAFRFILKLDGLPSVDELWRPGDVQAAIERNVINLGPFFLPPPGADKLIARFLSLIQTVTDVPRGFEGDERGGCWLWFYDNTHPLVRALHAAGHLIVTRIGRYLMALPQVDAAGALRSREELMKILASRVQEEFEVPCGRFSVLNSEDPDDLPFYCDFSDNDIFYNESWHERDY
jgi:hypothetical protein